MIHHVTFEVAPAEVDACLAFYALLGFTEVEPPPTITPGAKWLERGGTHIHLLQIEEPTHLPKGHAAVVVDDFEATFAALESAGHAPDRRRKHWGAARAFVRDPSGNLLELMAFPPAPLAQA